jgi:uncharacterized membrane protein YcaP (DUF421 family)
VQIRELLFQNWSVLLHTLIVSALSFVVLVALLRFFGKKMLLTTSAGSFAMTVALGNALATAALDESIGLAETTTGFATLMALQWVLFKLTSRSKWLEGMTRSYAAVVFFEGKLLPEAMRLQRVAPDDIYATIRQYGYPELEQVGAVVFESSGKLSVIPHSEDGKYPVLEAMLKEAKQ